MLRATDHGQGAELCVPGGISLLAQLANAPARQGSRMLLQRRRAWPPAQACGAPRNSRTVEGVVHW